LACQDAISLFKKVRFQSVEALVSDEEEDADSTSSEISSCDSEDDIDSSIIPKATQRLNLSVYKRVSDYRV